MGGCCSAHDHERPVRRDGAHVGDSGDGRLLPSQHQNALFYHNEVPCRPEGLLIDDLHRQWRGRYDILELNHTYIQWLFPIAQSQGMNPHSVRLQESEARAIASTEACRQRYLRSYELILDFFGILLVDSRTGRLQRNEAISPRNGRPHFEDRYANLKRNPHNNLRLSRIIQAHQQLGFRQWAYPLVVFLLQEVLETRCLCTGATLNSVAFWIKYLSDPQERKECEQYARRFGHR